MGLHRGRVPSSDRLVPLPTDGASEPLRVRVPSGSLPLLHRPRLLRRVSSALANGGLVVSGLYGSGKETLLLSWQQHTGVPVVWMEGWSLTEASGWPELQERLEGGSGPVVAAVRVSDRESADLERELAELRRRQRRLRLVHVVGLRASLGRTIDRAARITARDLVFTREEIAALARLAEAPLTDADADAVLADTGGYPLGVSAVIGLASERGRYDGDVLRASTDALATAAAAAVAEGSIPAQAWRRMLLTTLLEAPSLAQLGLIWDPESPAAVARVLESAGLATLLDGPAGEARLRLIPSLRTGLRRRLAVEMPARQLRTAVVDLVRRLATQGELAEALAVAAEHDIGSDLLEVLAPHWNDLARLPAEVVTATLRPVLRQAAPELVTAYVRATIDVTHTGHSGSVPEVDRRRSRALLEATDPDAEPAALRLTLLAALARMAGDHRSADAWHARAHDRLPATPIPDVLATVRMQTALTALGEGDLARAGDMVAQAQEALGAEGDPATTVLAAELDILLQGYLGQRHAATSPHHPPAPGTPAAAVRDLGEAARLIAQLEVAGAWQALARLPVATGNEDPAALLALRAQAEAMAHLLSGTATAGLGSLDVIDALLDGRPLSPFEATLLRNTRAEMLVAVGEAEAALTVLEEGGPAAGLVSVLVRCVVLLALGRAEAAAALVEPMLPSSSTWASNYPTWMLVVSALVFDELGDDDRADLLLGRGVAIASRSGAMLPFARQGAQRMTQLIERARQLRLDPPSRALLDRLEEARERMRLSSLQARLSDRELVVLRALQETDTTRTLAAMLHVSPNTVKSQLQSIYRKLGASTRQEALRAATMLGLIDESAPSVEL